MTDCSLLQPYLTKYQTDNPMLPFLEKDLKSMHLVVPTGCNTDVLKKYCSFLENQSFCYTYTSEGKRRTFLISVEEQLNNLSHQDKITSGDVRNLKKEGSNMFRFYYEKKSQKSVLHFMAVRNANVFGVRFQ